MLCLRALSENLIVQFVQHISHINHNLRLGNINSKKNQNNLNYR